VPSCEVNQERDLWRGGGRSDSRIRHLGGSTCQNCLEFGPWSMYLRQPLYVGHFLELDAKLELGIDQGHLPALHPATEISAAPSEL